MKFKKHKNQLKSINRVLLRHFLLLSAFLVILVECICFLIVVNTAKGTAKERLIRVGREAAVLVNKEEDVEEYIQKYRQEGINVYVLSPDGEVLFPSGGEKWNGDIEEVIAKLNKADKEYAPLIYSKKHTLNYAMSLEYNGGGLVYPSQSTRDISTTRMP